MFFVAHFSILFDFKAKSFFSDFVLGFGVCFCSQGINNFHNACGHYGEISPRQQPITARDFTESNLFHIIVIIILHWIPNNGFISQSAMAFSLLPWAGGVLYQCHGGPWTLYVFITSMGATMNYGFFSTVIGAHTYFLSGPQNFSRRP